MNLCTRQWFILAALCALPRPWGQRHDLVLAIARPCPMRGSRFAQWNTFRPRRLDGGRRLAGGSGDVFVTHKMNLKDSFFMRNVWDVPFVSVWFVCLSLICLQCCLNLHVISQHIPTYPNKWNETNRLTHTFMFCMHSNCKAGKLLWRCIQRRLDTQRHPGQLHCYWWLS
jgi:hypothetical protein